MNIVDIAKLSGLSKSTVSRYLNGGGVSKKAATKIAAVIQETGFEMNLSASRLKTNRSNLIGVMIDGFSSPSVSRELASISATCHELGYQPFIMIDETNEDNKVANTKALVRQGVDAIILGTPVFTPELRRVIDTAGIPVLHLGQRDPNYTWCKTNERLGGKLLGEHIAASHPKRLVYLSMRLSDLTAGVERRDAILASLDQTETETRVIEFDNYLDNSGEYANQALAFKPDCIVCASDRYCLTVLQALAERGLSVPDDVRLAGFGNHAFGELPSVSLTTVAYNYEAIGRDAAIKAVALAQGEDVEQGCDDYPVRLIVRRSSIPPCLSGRNEASGAAHANRAPGGGADAASSGADGMADLIDRLA